MNLQPNNVYFTYVDWTLEKTPRPFYVGKGTIYRVHRRERNAYWKNIATKYGWRREVELATKDESFAFEEEKRRIAELGTFEDGTSGRWGANLTEGGEGASGWKPTQAWIQARSGENNPFYGKKRPEISAAMKGEQNPFFGRTHSSEWKRRKSESMTGSRHHLYGKHHDQATRQRIGESVSGERNGMYQAGEKHPNAHLTLEQVAELRFRYESTKQLPLNDPTRLSYNMLAREYGITKSHAANIVAKRYWKEESE